MPTSFSIPEPAPGAKDATVVTDSGSPMRQRISDYDWDSTVLGPLTGWHAKLRVIVELMLDSAEPMVIWWGPERIQIYNDAYGPRVDGAAGSIALGQPAASTGKHGWAKIEPLAASVIATGTSKMYTDFAFDIERNGVLQEAYWTYSLTPIRDQDDVVNGVLMLSGEVTERTISTRRQRTLDLLRSELADVDDFQQLSEAAARAAAQNPTDLRMIKLVPHHAPA